MVLMVSGWMAVPSRPVGNARDTSLGHSGQVAKRTRSSEEASGWNWDWGGVGVSEETDKATLGLGEPFPREEGEGKSPRSVESRSAPERGHRSRRLVR